MPYNTVKKYELTLLINPQVEKEEAKELLEKIADLIREKNGIAVCSEIIKTKLSCPINKKREGFLAVISLSLSAEKIKEIKEKIKSEKDILRDMIVAKKEKGLKPAKPAKAKTLKEEKGEEKNKKVNIEKLDEKINEILK